VTFKMIHPIVNYHRFQIKKIVRII